jgi:hypothetical protein
MLGPKSQFTMDDAGEIEESVLTRAGTGQAGTALRPFSATHESIAPNEYFPAAIPSLIDAAVASFDADRDTARRIQDDAFWPVMRGPY